MAEIGTLHHIELRTSDLETAADAWGWLLGELGYEPYQRWNAGMSWRQGATYIVLEVVSGDTRHDRRRPGLSHLAFHAGDSANVDRLWALAPDRGWSRLYEDRWPWAGGPDHYAAFLDNAERFKIELVASGADQSV